MKKIAIAVMAAIIGIVAQAQEVKDGFNVGITVPVTLEYQEYQYYWAYRDIALNVGYTYNITPKIFATAEIAGVYSHTQSELIVGGTGHVPSSYDFWGFMTVGNIGYRLGKGFDVFTGAYGRWVYRHESKAVEPYTECFGSAFWQFGVGYSLGHFRFSVSYDFSMNANPQGKGVISTGIRYNF